MFKIHRQSQSSNALTRAYQKVNDPKKDILTRWKHLKFIVENSPEKEVNKFLAKYHSVVYFIFMENFLLAEASIKLRGSNRAQKDELGFLIAMFELIFIHLPDLIHQKWQCNSIGFIIKMLLHSNNSLKVRREGLHFYLLWMRCLRENAQPWTFELYKYLVPGYAGKNLLLSIDNIINMFSVSRYGIQQLPITSLLPSHSIEKYQKNQTKFFLNSLLELMALKVQILHWKDKDIMTIKSFVFLWDMFLDFYIVKTFKDFDHSTSVYSPCLGLPELPVASEESVATQSGLAMPDSTLLEMKVNIIKWVITFTTSIEKSKTSLDEGKSSEVKGKVTMTDDGNQLDQANPEVENRRKSFLEDVQSFANDVSSEDSDQSIRLPDTYQSTSNTSSLADKEPSLSSLTSLDFKLKSCTKTDEWIIQSVLFSTKKSINSIHELFRQAFLLPISEVATIKKVVKIYQHWIQDKDVPIFMQYPPSEERLFSENMHSLDDLTPSFENISEFAVETMQAAQICAGPETTYQLFITNSSYVFFKSLPTIGSKSVHLHVDLCKTILGLYRYMVVNVYLALETWMQLLNILMFIVKNVLGDRPLSQNQRGSIRISKHSRSVPHKLCGPIFQTLMIAWIKANLTVPLPRDLWDELVEVLSKHCHWEELIFEWGKNMEIITRVMARYVYKLEIYDLPLDRLTEQKAKRHRKTGRDEQFKMTQESLYEQAFNRAVGRRSISFIADTSNGSNFRRSFAVPLFFIDRDENSNRFTQTNSSTAPSLLSAAAKPDSNHSQQSSETSLKKDVASDVRFSLSSSSIGSCHRLRRLTSLSDASDKNNLHKSDSQNGIENESNDAKIDPVDASQHREISEYSLYSLTEKVKNWSKRNAHRKTVENAIESDFASFEIQSIEELGVSCVKDIDEFDELANRRLHSGIAYHSSSPEVRSISSDHSGIMENVSSTTDHKHPDAKMASSPLPRYKDGFRVFGDCSKYLESHDSVMSLFESLRHSKDNRNISSSSSHLKVSQSDQVLSYLHKKGSALSRQTDTESSTNSSDSDAFRVKEAHSTLPSDSEAILQDIPEEHSNSQYQLVYRPSKFLRPTTPMSVLFGIGENCDNCGTLTGGFETGWTPPVAAAMWHRMLGILGDINAISYPNIHKLAFQYILQIWTVLFKMRQNIGISSNDEPAAECTDLVPPLQIFSPWAFKAALGLPESHKEGKLHAYQLLCNATIQRDHDTPLEREHLAQFYCILHETLHSNDQDVINKVIGSCSQFFSYDLPGSSLLTLDFLNAINKVCSCPNLQAPKVEAQTILGSLLFFPCIYKDIPVIKPNAGEPSMEICLNIKDRIVGALLLACKSEPSTAARCVALSSTGVWLYHELVFCSDHHPKVKEAINVLLVTLKFNSRTVAFAACSQLRLLAQCCNGLMKSWFDGPIRLLEVMSMTTITLLQDQEPKKGESMRQLIITLLLTILDWCMAVPVTLLTERSARGRNLMKTIFKAIQFAAHGRLYPITKQSLNLSSLAASDFDPKLQLNRVQEAPNANTRLKPTASKSHRNQENYTSLKLTAQLVLNHLINYFGQFPMGRGSSVLSALVSEYHDLIDDTTELTPALFNSPDVQFFSYNDTCLISVIEIPAELGTPGCGPTAGMSSSDRCVRYIVRDSGGKYCWDSYILYGPSDIQLLTEPVECSSFHTIDSGIRQAAEDIVLDYNSYAADASSLQPGLIYAPLPLAGKGVNDGAKDKLDQLLQYISSSSSECRTQLGLPLNIPSSSLACIGGSLEEDAINCLLRHHQDLAKTIAEEASFTNRRNSAQHSIPVTKSDSPFFFARLMCMELGFLSRESRQKVHILAKNERLLRELKNLDSRNCRETHKVALFYIAEGQEEKISILSNCGGSKEYEEFVAGLGWEVDLKTHSGFRGKLQSDGSNGESCPYYATSTLEVIFHVATRFPSHDEAARNLKIRHLGNDEVHIVWSEHHRDYRRGIIPTEFGDVLIVIYPIKHGLFRIQIIKKQEIPHFGPLFDGAVVNAKVLPALVRETAINAGRAKRSLINLYQPFYEERTRYLQQILSQFKDQHTFEEYCAGLYRPGPFRKKKRHKPMNMNDIASQNSPGSCGSSQPHQTPGPTFSSPSRSVIHDSAKRLILNADSSRQSKSANVSNPTDASSSALSHSTVKASDNPVKKQFSPSVNEDLSRTPEKPKINTKTSSALGTPSKRLPE